MSTEEPSQDVHMEMAKGMGLVLTRENWEGNATVQQMKGCEQLGCVQGMGMGLAQLHPAGRDWERVGL